MKKVSEVFTLLAVLLSSLIIGGFDVNAETDNNLVNLISPTSFTVNTNQSMSPSIKGPTILPRESINIPGVFGSEIASAKVGFAKDLLPNDQDLINKITSTAMLDEEYPFIFKKNIKEGVFYPLIRIDDQEFNKHFSTNRIQVIFTLGGDGPGKVDWNKVNFMDSEDSIVHTNIPLNKISDTQYSYDLDYSMIKDRKFGDFFVFGIKMTDLDYDKETSLKMEYIMYDENGKETARGDNINAVSYYDEILDINFSDPLELCFGAEKPDYKKDITAYLKYSSDYIDKHYIVDRTDKVQLDDKVKYDIPGEYTVDYSVSSETGATSIVKKRKVIINENNITINYVDEDNNTLSSYTVPSTKKGNSFSVKSPDFEGYKLKDEAQATVTGEFSCKPQTITVPYGIKRSVIVKYIDEDNNEIIKEETLTGLKGDSYDASYKNIYGYTYVKTEGDESGVFTEDDITVTHVYKRAEAKIKVTYEDSDGHPIATSDTVTGFVNDSYNASPKDIDGYTYVKTKGDVSGVFTEDDITVTHVYKRTEAKVTVIYKDTTGEELGDSEVLHGFVNDEYTTENLSFDGYELVEIPSNANGKFTKDDIVVEYVYKKKDPPVVNGTVTIRYVDENGFDLSDSVESSGPIGQKYSFTPLPINGYTHILTTGETDGKYSEEDNVITFYYRKNDDSSPEPISNGQVTIWYVDENGLTIKTPTNISGTVNTPYQTTPDEIEGYTLTVIPANRDGVFTYGNTDVIYVYKANEGTIPPTSQYGQVTTWFVDENGDSLATQLITTGLVDSAYSTNAIDIPGYSLVSIPDNQSGVFINGNIDVTYMYKKDDITVNPPVAEYGTVTSWFVDTEGNSIEDSIVQTGLVGTDYQTNPIGIEGYTLVSIPTNESGQFINGNIDVTYVYKKNEVPTPPVTIKAKVITQFVDENGVELSPSDIQYGNVGDDYQTSSIDIPGYTLVKIPDNKVGVFTEEDIYVTYVYKKNPETIVNPDGDENDKPHDNGNENNNTDQNNNTEIDENPVTIIKENPVNVETNIIQPSINLTSNNEPQKTLPKTGERSNNVFILLGVVVSILGSAVIFYRFK